MRSLTTAPRFCKPHVILLMRWWVFSSGIGNDAMVPSGKIGLAQPPYPESNPFLLRMIFIRVSMLRSPWEQGSSFKHAIDAVTKRNLLLLSNSHWSAMNIQWREAFFSVSQYMVLTAIWPDFRLCFSQYAHDLDRVSKFHGSHLSKTPDT